MEPKVWISWETNRRNKELSQALGCAYHRFDYSLYPPISRYLLSVVKTCWLVLTKRHHVIFAPCPSLVLVFLLAVLGHLTKFHFVIDAHNATFEYLQSKRRGVQWCMKYALSQANLIIVSNSYLVTKLSQFKSKVTILSNELPNIQSRPPFRDFRKEVGPVITLISSFARDEPIENFLKAISSLDTPFVLYVTGSKAKAGNLLRFESSKICFTDFLDEPEFEALIQHADLLVDLTTREDCLVCGAVEGLAVEKPLLLSDTKVLREVFSQGCLFAKDDVREYVRAIEHFLDNQESLRLGIRALKDEYKLCWERQFAEVEKMVTLR